MRKSQVRKWAIVALLLVAVTAYGVATVPQQQQSGGQSVSVTNVPHVIVDTAPSTVVTGPLTDAQLRASAVPVSFTQQALPAGTAKVGVVYPYTSCGTTSFTKALQAMPTVSTTIASATTCVLVFDISNTSGGSLTVTVSDNAGTPVNWLNAVTMLAGETREYSWPNGKNFASGIKVIASGAGITYSVEGLQ